MWNHRWVGGGVVATFVLAFSARASAEPRVSNDAAGPGEVIERARRGYHADLSGRAALFSDAVSSDFDSPAVSLLGGAIGFSLPFGRLRYGFELEFLGMMNDVRLADGGALTGSTVDAMFVSTSLVWAGAIPLGRFELVPALILGIVSAGPGGDNVKVTGGPSSGGVYFYDATTSSRVGIRISALYWFAIQNAGVAPLVSLGLDGRDLTVKRYDDTGAVLRHDGFLAEVSLRVGVAFGATH